MVETQGRCLTCNVRYVWTERMQLQDAYCPKCGEKLQRTTHLLQAPVINKLPMPAWAAKYQREKYAKEKAQHGK